MLMTKVNCCCCAGVVVVAPWCCCYLLLLLVGIPDSDKNVSLQPPTATPHSDGMFSQRLMRRMRNVKAMARGKQRGGIVRFSMYIHLYTHTHIRLSQSQGVSRLHELIDTGIGGIGGNKMCLPNNFICEKWHSWNIHAGKKKKTRLTAMPMLSARRSCSRSEFQYIQARAWSWHRGASGFIGLPDGVDENWRVQCSRQLLQFDDRIVQNGSRVARNP